MARSIFLLIFTSIALLSSWQSLADNIFALESEGYINYLERSVNPSGYDTKIVHVETIFNYVPGSKDKDIFYKPINTNFLSLNKDISINPKLRIDSITLNNKKVKFDLWKVNESESLLVIGEKGKYFSKFSNKFIVNYSLDYSHYKDIGVIRKFTNSFVKREGDLPIRKVILKVNAPPMTKIDGVDYKNTIDGVPAHNYSIDGSNYSVKMQSSGDISDKESMSVNATIGKVATTYWGQDASTLFPTLPIDNDYYRICFSLLAIVVLSKLAVMLLEAFLSSSRAREYVIAMRSGIAARDKLKYLCRYSYK